ncbi:hypothetical protein [Priestia endophytica]|uniref:Transposase/invertase (TIGR01784 family) n=1 Tax=Priestia endophytica DSM 13796 TaxID=1121089 RepID=A0A1I6C0F1_9BACI|nr:hypothetical protein [Priestia endophytica]SFQ86656.1 conserved hypothetical protein (putative transposase or invertase) [Priestia endophytica DSM 13796]
MHLVGGLPTKQKVNAKFVPIFCGITIKITVKVVEEIAVKEDEVLKNTTNKIDESQRSSRNPEALLAYELRRKAILDEKSALKRAESRGREKGRKEVIRDIALGLIQKGIDKKTISEIVGLSQEEIDKLR